MIDLQNYVASLQYHLYILQKYSLWLSCGIMLITFISAGIALHHLWRIKLQHRANFTYTIYQDFMEWLKNHKECRDWVFKLDQHINAHYLDWEFDDFLGYFEALWSLEKLKLVDMRMVYDLFSDYLIDIYESNDFELKKIIEKLRSEEGKQDYYTGVEKLYTMMKAMSSKQ